MKNQTKPIGERSYETVNSERVEFFKFDEDNNAQFEGKFIKSVKLSESNRALLFEDMNGARFQLPSHEQLIRATSEKGVGFYRITYKGEENIGDNKTLKKYIIEFSKK